MGNALLTRYSNSNLSNNYRLLYDYSDYNCNIMLSSANEYYDCISKNYISSKTGASTINLNINSCDELIVSMYLKIFAPDYTNTLRTIDMNFNDNNVSNNIYGLYMTVSFSGDGTLFSTRLFSYKTSFNFKNIGNNNIVNALLSNYIFFSSDGLYSPDKTSLKTNLNANLYISFSSRQTSYGATLQAYSFKLWTSKNNPMTDILMDTVTN